MLIEGVDHLPNLVELVDEEERHLLVGVLDGRCDLLETPHCHVGVEVEQSPLEHVDCFR
jgi:hypothetical protein